MKEKSVGLPATDSATAPNGAAWAALLSAGIGAFVFGLITDASETSARISAILQWYRPAGSLSGVAISTVLAWIVIWAALHARWKNTSLQNQRTLMTITIILSLAALAATFPPFYDLFGG